MAGSKLVTHSVLPIITIRLDGLALSSRDERGLDRLGNGISFTPAQGDGDHHPGALRSRRS